MKRLALLIDAENISHEVIHKVLNISNGFGDIVIKRAYGNWTTAALQMWKQKIIESNIKSIQNFNTSPGKNASDISLTIDAMDILYSNRVDAFVIVTSDSDFSSLISRLIEDGKDTYVIGYSKSPKALQDASTHFMSIDQRPETLDLIEIKESLELAWRISKNRQGEWLDISEGARYLKQIDNTFNPGKYGFKKFSRLIQSLNNFELYYKRGKVKGEKLYFYKPY